MASFDPSVISQIPDMAGNPVQARANAYKLADLIDESQLRKLQLAGAQREEKDDAALRSLASRSDLSTQEGRMKFVGEASKISPSKGMQFMRESSQEALTEFEMKSKQLGFLHETVGPAALQVRDALQQGGPAMAAARYQQLAPQINEQMKAVGINQQLPPTMDFNNPQSVALLEQQIGASQQAGKMLSERKTAADQKRADARLDLSQRSADRADRALADREAKDERARKEGQEGVISDDAAQLAVDRILNGEQARDVLANFGRGKQGPANIAKVQNLLASTAKARGISAQDISASMIEMKGLAKEEQTEAAISGKIRYAEKEIQQIAPQVMSAANKVGRGQFVPWNKLRNMAASSISDPNLKQLKVYLNTLTNSYDVLGGRGGTDVDKRAHTRELLDAADSPQALQAAVDAIVNEAKLSGTAATQSMQVDRSRLGGNTQGGGAAPAAPAASSGGWGKATVVGQ